MSDAGDAAARLEEVRRLTAEHARQLEDVKRRWDDARTAVASARHGLSEVTDPYREAPIWQILEAATHLSKMEARAIQLETQISVQANTWQNYYRELQLLEEEQRLTGQ